MQDKSERTEQATPRRIEKARQEGQFPTSREFVGSVQFLLFAVLLSAWGTAWLAQNEQITRWALRQAFRSDFTPAGLWRLWREVIWLNFRPLLAAAGVLVAAALAAQLATTKMGFSLKRLLPDFGRLKPGTRLRETFRQNLSGLLKAVVLLPLFAAAVWHMFRDNLARYLSLPLAEIRSGAASIALSIEDLLWKAAGVFLALGVIDLLRQRRRHFRDLRMTKQEVREEAKELEGNPLMKMRIRRLLREVLRRRMMKQVPKATAVVVNPTHYAVAIRYRMESPGAPRVVAKGRNYLARKIRELAAAHGVPIIENPPLAQALYQAVEVGQEIPPHFYRAVAEILAYIYRLMNGRLPG